MTDADDEKKVKRLPVRGDARLPPVPTLPPVMRTLPPIRTLPPVRTQAEDEEDLRRRNERLRERIDQQQRISLARDLLVAGRVATVEEAFRVADAFAEVAAQRLPNEPDPFDLGPLAIG